MFRRKASTVSETGAPIDAATVGPAASDDRSIPLLDRHGHADELVQSIDLGHRLWRASAASELDGLPDRQTVCIAAYSADDIEAARSLMARFTTIVLSMGVGPQHGSRALMLGAVGYVEAGSDRGAMQGAFSDAVQRGRTRRLREAVA